MGNLSEYYNQLILFNDELVTSFYIFTLLEKNKVEFQEKSHKRNPWRFMTSIKHKTKNQSNIKAFERKKV